jgi:hypothetical protein
MTEKASAREFAPRLKKSKREGSKPHLEASLPELDLGDYFLRFLAAEISITTASTSRSKHNWRRNDPRYCKQHVYELPDVAVGSVSPEGEHSAPQDNGGDPVARS